MTNELLVKPSVARMQPNDQNDGKQKENLFKQSDRRACEKPNQTRTLLNQL